MNNNLVHSIYEGTHIITCINSKRTKKYTTDTNRFIKLHYRKCAHNCVIETDKIWKKLRFQTLIRLLSFFVEQTFPAKTSETLVLQLSQFRRERHSKARREVCQFRVTYRFVDWPFFCNNFFV
jgi:hypothetical protein